MNLYKAIFVTEPVVQSPYTSFVLAEDIEGAMKEIRDDMNVNISKFLEINLIFDDVDQAIGWPGTSKK